MIKATWRGKSSFHYLAYRSSWKEVIAGTQSTNLSRSYRAILCPGLLNLLSYTWHTTLPRTVLPMVGWALPHQPSIKKKKKSSLNHPFRAQGILQKRGQVIRATGTDSTKNNMSSRHNRTDTYELQRPWQQAGPAQVQDRWGSQLRNGEVDMNSHPYLRSYLQMSIACEGKFSPKESHQVY